MHAPSASEDPTPARFVVYRPTALGRAAAVLRDVLFAAASASLLVFSALLLVRVGTGEIGPDFDASTTPADIALVLVAFAGIVAGSLGALGCARAEHLSVLRAVQTGAVFTPERIPLWFQRRVLLEHDYGGSLRTAATFLFVSAGIVAGLMLPAALVTGVMSDLPELWWGIIIASVVLVLAGVLARRSGSLAAPRNLRRVAASGAAVRVWTPTLIRSLTNDVARERTTSSQQRTRTLLDRLLSGGFWVGGIGLLLCIGGLVMRQPCRRCDPRDLPPVADAIADVLWIAGLTGCSIGVLAMGVTVFGGLGVVIGRLRRLGTSHARPEDALPLVGQNPAVRVIVRCVIGAGCVVVLVATTVMPSAPWAIVGLGLIIVGVGGSLLWAERGAAWASTAVGRLRLVDNDVPAGRALFALTGRAPVAVRAARGKFPGESTTRARRGRSRRRADGGAAGPAIPGARGWPDEVGDLF